MRAVLFCWNITCPHPPSPRLRRTPPDFQEILYKISKKSYLSLWERLSIASVPFLLLHSNILYAGNALAQSVLEERPIVLELFTSQGCASCPPADELLGVLARDNSLLPLSFHVDYWNRLGWKDPFSHPSFSNRQALYNQGFKTPGNYTPQIVVDGRFETIGSYYSAIMELINEARREAGNIPLQLTSEPNGLAISIAASTLPSSQASIWLIGYDNQKNSYIAEGENRGKQLSSYNVVHYMDRIGTYYGLPVKLHVQFHWKEPPGNIAILLQDGMMGRILGVGTFTPSAPRQ